MSTWDGEAQPLLQVIWWDNSLQQIGNYLEDRLLVIA